MRNVRRAQFNLVPAFPSMAIPTTLEVFREADLANDILVLLRENGPHW